MHLIAQRLLTTVCNIFVRHIKQAEAKRLNNFALSSRKVKPCIQ